MLNWIRRRTVLGAVLLVGGLSLLGVSLSSAAVGIGTSRTTVIGRTIHVTGPTRRVTVRLPGRVIRRVDHVLVVQTPRYVFVYKGRRHVIPPKIVRILWHDPRPSDPPVAAALFGSVPTASTVTVPVTVPVSGATSTVTVEHTTTEPPTTVTSTITVTVSVGLGDPPGGSP